MTKRKSKEAYRNAVFAIANNREETNGKIFKAIIEAIAMNYPKNPVIIALAREAGYVKL